MRIASVETRSGWVAMRIASVETRSGWVAMRIASVETRSGWVAHRVVGVACRSELMSAFALASAIGWLLVVVAATFRSRAYAMFRAVMLGVHSLLLVALLPRLAWAMPLIIYLQIAVHIQSLGLIRPRLRRLPYRVLISIPAAFFSAGTLLGLPWVLASAFSVELPLPWLPYLLSLVGVIQSLVSRSEEVDITVWDGHVGEGMRRYRPGPVRVERPLRIVQITDPHLGPFMSVERLRRIAERAVQKNPDLVLLTGDYLTMESQADPSLLARALEPLAALKGRVYACFGNHDHEAPRTVRAALEQIGARLLLDDSALVETEAGLVQVLGFDYKFGGRKAHLAAVCAQHPRVPGALRLALLHDPGAFRHLPEGEADLVLSGHTHGGQVGLVSVGLPWTLLRVLMNAPDHGLWARGNARLYVHRGTGHYGFPLRLGVPGEDSLLRVHAPGLSGSADPERGRSEGGLFGSAAHAS